MKKLALILCSLAIGFTTIAQTMEKGYYDYVSKDTCKSCYNQHKRYMDGRAIFISGSLTTYTPGYIPTNYGTSFEIGVWGTEKKFSYSIVGDFMNNIDTFINKNDSSSKSIIAISRFIGIKGYYTFFSNKNSSYMIYIAPKFCFAGGQNNLLEIGLNPNYSINKYMLLSLSLSNQIYKVDNPGNKPSGGNFNESIWHPGISVGRVIYR